MLGDNILFSELNETCIDKLNVSVTWLKFAKLLADFLDIKAAEF